MGTIPTVEINRDGVCVVINECDMQKDDVLWAEKPAPKKRVTKKKSVKKSD